MFQQPAVNLERTLEIVPNMNWVLTFFATYGEGGSVSDLLPLKKLFQIIYLMVRFAFETELLFVWMESNSYALNMQLFGINSAITNMGKTFTYFLLWTD